MGKARCMHEFHTAKGVDYSYGGFVEIRSRMFADSSYISHARCYVHLGVDINVPAWEEVCFPSSAQVLRVVHDPDTEIGWGTRVDLAHPTQPIVFMFGQFNYLLFPIKLLTLYFCFKMAILSLCIC